MAASTCSFRTNLALIQLSTLPASLPVRALGMEAEMERGRGSVPIQTPFCCLFTRLEKWEVNKQVLVFNCGPLIALPSSVLECSTPPFTVRHFDNLSFNFSTSFCLSSFCNSFGIHLFFPSLTSPFESPVAELETVWRAVLSIWYFAGASPRDSRVYRSSSNCLYIKVKTPPSITAGLLLKTEWQRRPTLTLIWCRFNCMFIPPVQCRLSFIALLILQKQFCTSKNEGNKIHKSVSNLYNPGCSRFLCAVQTYSLAGKYKLNLLVGNFKKPQTQQRDAAGERSRWWWCPDGTRGGRVL